MAAQQVIGVRDTLSMLRTVDKSLYWQAVGDIKRAAAPLALAVKGNVPASAPLSGMDHKGRTGWRARGATRVTTKFGGRVKRGPVQEWPLVRVVLSGAAVSMYDMAGRGSANQLGAALSARNGAPSRAAWPAAQAHLGSVQAAVEAACETVMRDFTRAAAYRGQVS